MDLNTDLLIGEFFYIIIGIIFIISGVYTLKDKTLAKEFLLLYFGFF